MFIGITCVFHRVDQVTYWHQRLSKVIAKKNPAAKSYHQWGFDPTITDLSAYFVCCQKGWHWLISQ